MSETILIVDDSLTVRMDLAEAFEAAGFHVLPCATVAEAREALSRTVVDVAILDVLLPDGDGVELLRELRSTAATAEAVVLVLSAEAEVKDRIRGLTMGANEYVGKPYERDYLVARARELLRLRHAETGEHRPTVLVIDDSATFREEMRQALEASGYAVVVAGSGEEGLRKAAQRLPSAMIVDGHLPGMDGATVIRHARLDAALRNVPCVLLTGSQEQGAELVALDAGADAFVRKEDEIEVILARVAAVLRRAPIALLGESTASLLGPKRILAVDDSATYLHELASTLQGEGYDVVLARSGEEALELLAVQSVDCILLDLVMPGLSGQETCRRIKAAPVVRDLPIIMLTAVEDRAAMIDGLSAGADDYISKSSEFEVLRARVRAQIRRKQFEDENRGIREELLRREIEARAARELAETRAALVDELKRKNMELDSFTYSVSHDLRAPLRRIDGFSQMVLEDYSAGLDPKAREYLESVHAGVRRMTDLIDDLLKLSRIGRAELNLTQVDMTALARAVALELETGHPDRPVRFTATEGLSAQADPGLMRIVLENLLGNAWKFTRSTARPEVQFDADGATSRTTYFVRDNGVGFDMAYVEKLFAPFQRLHAEHEFPGTGIGLATVQRIVDRHSGRIWAESVKGEGTTIFWTIGTRKGLKGGGSLLTVPGQDPRAKSY